MSNTKERDCEKVILTSAKKSDLVIQMSAITLKVTNQSTQKH